MDQLFGIHGQALLFRERRAELIANNLANVDTPHYLARDMEFKSALNQQTLKLAQTNTAHLPSQDDQGAEDVLQYRIPMQASLDGNTVDGQIEQAHYAENAMHYMASLNFIKEQARELLTAIKGE